MSKIVLTEFVSLDGVMEEPGWTFQFDRGPDGDKFKTDELFGCESLLLGRVTYQDSRRPGRRCRTLANSARG
jgi:hypothetical protein